VVAFFDWLIDEAKAALAVDGKGALSSPPPAVRSGGAARRARSTP
jgi:hypothetical protein